MEHYTLIACYGRHRRLVARSNLLLWPTPQAVVMQQGLAFLCLITSHMTVTKAKIEQVIIVVFFVLFFERDKNV